MTEDRGMPGDRLMRIHSPEFQAMSERVLRVTELTSRLNVLPFDDEAGKAALFEQILGRPLPARVTIYPPFYTDHGLHLDLAERVFINQGCTFLDYAGIRLGERVMVGPKVTFITIGHPVDPDERTGVPDRRADRRGGERVDRRRRHDPARRQHRPRRRDRRRRDRGRRRARGEPGDRHEGHRAPHLVND